jgi:gliding motility-associated-like protein
MTKRIVITSLLLFSIISFSQKNKNTNGFIENKGQIVDQNYQENKSVLYLLNTNGLNIQLRKNGFSYDVYEIKTKPSSKKQIQKDKFNFTKSENQPEIKQKIKFHRLDIDFLNSNSNVKLVSEEKSVDYDNYYNVIHAPNGITNVHKYQKVTYQNIYNKIDIVFFIPEDSTKVVEYNFVVKPGGKISDIQMQFKGAKTELNNNKIKMTTRFGDMEETLPMSWIEEENNKKQVSINYKKIKNNVYGLESSEDILGKKVIVDPVPIRLWGTFYGGENDDISQSITNDKLNNVYISGSTLSSNNIATSGIYQSILIGNSNIFIAKFNPNGIRIYGTYFICDNAANPAGMIKTDNLNNLYLFGNELNNTNLATPNAFQVVKNNYFDLFLVKFDEFGIRQWATYYGGNGNEDYESICFDSNNNIYIAGSTNSTDIFSTPGAHQINNNSALLLYNPTDAFIAKFDSNGNRLWSTFYGGEGSDGFTNISISNDNYLYASGIQNSSTNISTPGSFQENYVATNITVGGMIVKFDLNGQRIWGTYIADNTINYSGELKNNYMYLYGHTYNNYNLGTLGTMYPNFQNPIPGSSLSYFPIPPISSYMLKFDVTNQQIVWGTYFIDRIHQLSVNNNDEIYFVGETGLQNDISTADGFLPTNNGYSSFLIKLNPNCQKIWGTYYKGDGGTSSPKIQIDYDNNIYMYGQSNGNTIGMATSGAHQTSPNSNPDIFLVKFKDCFSATTASSNTPTCIGSTLNLTATGGTNYSWTGPNGFTSNQQNPSISNVNTTHSGQYTCSITGTGGCDGIQTINVFVGDNTKPIPTTTPLSTINGDCNTIISTPTAADNCSGLINGTTTDQLTGLLSGTHTIQWTYNDGNGNIETQNQTVIISIVSLPTLTSPQTFCIQQNATLNTIAITGQNIKWYDAPTNGNLLPNTTALVNGTTYYTSQTINGCESNRVPVSVQILNTPAQTGNANQSFCSTQNATVADIITNGTNVIWYNSATNTTPLANTTLLTNNTTYFAAQTINGCESVNRLAVTISLINTLNATNYAEVICDDLNDNIEIKNLTTYNSNLISSTGNTFKYYSDYNEAFLNSNQQITNFANYNLALGTNTFYVRIDSPNTCFQIVTLTLELVSKPIIPINDIEPLCEGKNITLNAGNNYDTYTWSTGEITQQITITQPGSYSVTVTENHGATTCTSTKNFTVVNSNIPTIQEIISSDWTENNNTITVLLQNNSQGDYEYSLNGIDFQNNPVFNNLEAGEYTIFVRDKNGCGMVSGELYLLMYPKFFTPNGDGYNDYWKIKFSEIEPNLTIKIFDRYGKLMKQLGTNSLGWDGKYLGKDVPSSDYWFIVTRENGKEYKGHFSLKR